jgi:hypothetical protein
VRKERAIAEERSPDKGRPTNKRRSGKAWSTDDGRSTGEAGPASKAATEPGAPEPHAAAEPAEPHAATMECTTAHVHAATEPAPTLGGSVVRQQHCQH